MSSGSTDIARDLARSLQYVKRAEGVPFVDEKGVWLLSRPAPVEQWDPQVPRTLGSRTYHPTRREFANLIGAREVKRVTPGWLGRLSYHLGRVDPARVRELAEDGHRPLRRYRDVDLNAFLRDRRADIDRWSLVLDTEDAVRACVHRSEGTSLEVLVAAVPARALVLANWSLDPCRELRGGRAEKALLAQLRSSSEPAVLALAGALLAKLAPGAPHLLRGELASLPDVAQKSFHAATKADSAPPVLVAHASLASAAMPAWPREMPADQESALRRTCERLAVLGYPVAASKVATAVTAPWRNARAEARQAREHVAQFVQIVEAAQTGQLRQLPPEQREIAARLCELPALEGPRARHVARGFRDWMEPRVLLSRRALRSAAIRGLREDGLQGAGLALVTAWDQMKQREHRDAEVDHLSTSAATALYLHFPDLPASLPAHFETRAVRNLIEVLSVLPETKVAQAYERLIELPNKRLLNASEKIFKKYPFELGIKVLERDMISDIWRFDQPDQIRAYLEFLEALEHRPIPGVSKDSPWLRGAFTSPLEWASSLMLRLVNEQSSEMGTNDRIEQLAQVAALLDGDRPEFRDAIEDWQKPRVVSPPPEFDQLRDLMPFCEQELIQYLHYRRLMDDDERFSQALVEVLEFERKELEQTEFFRDELARDDLAIEKRKVFEQQLATLVDVQARQGRHEAAIRRAHNRLKAAVSELEGESLECVLDDVAASVMGGYLDGVELPRPLPDGLRTALVLLHNRDVDHELLRDFFSDVVAERSFAEHSENRAWLDSVSGFDVAKWVTGFEATVAVSGESVRIYTEDDPLRVLRMGSYFDTCLSLRADGFSAWSTLINALDINKHVVYAAREDGTVLARKLIGATADGRLAGYRTYSHLDREETRLAFNRAIGEFARDCGLVLSHSAQPEVLHGTRWYDDGNEIWLGQGADPGALYEADDAVLSRRLVDSMADEDWEELEALATWASDAQIRRAAAYRIWMRQPERAGRIRLPGGALCELLLHLGNLDWIETVLEAGVAHHGSIELPWDRPPLDAETFARFLERFEQMLSDPAWQSEIRRWGWVRPSLMLARCRPTDLAKYLRLTRRMSDQDDQAVLEESEDYFLGMMRSWEELLCVAMQREPQLEAVSDLLDSGFPIARRLGLRVAAQVTLDDAICQKLRRMLRGLQGDELELAAVALGMQGNSEDAWHLLSLFRRESGNVAYAAAVVATGDCDAAGEVRETWNPPSNPWEYLTDGRWIAYARAVRSPKLCDMLLKRIKRAARLLADPEADTEERAEAAAEIGSTFEVAVMLADPDQVAGCLESLPNEVQEEYELGACIELERQFCEAAAGDDTGAMLASWQDLWLRYRNIQSSAGGIVDPRDFRADRVMREGLLDGVELSEMYCQMLGYGQGHHLVLSVGNLLDCPHAKRSEIVKAITWHRRAQALFLERMAQQDSLAVAFEEIEWPQKMPSEVAELVLVDLEFGDDAAHLANQYIDAVHVFGTERLAEVLEIACKFVRPSTTKPLVTKYAQDLPEELSKWPALSYVLAR